MYFKTKNNFKKQSVTQKQTLNWEKKNRKTSFCACHTQETTKTNLDLNCSLKTSSSWTQTRKTMSKDGQARQCKTTNFTVSNPKKT